jgi:hypothetical protein
LCLSAVVQSFLRVREVARFLKCHVCSGDLFCLACAAWKCRLRLGSAKSAGSFDDIVAAGELPSNDVTRLVDVLLQGMIRQGEAGGSLPAWPCVSDPVSCAVTDVDVVFSFVMEIQRKCSKCGHQSVIYEKQCRLKLDLVADDDGQQDLSQLYVRSCLPQSKCGLCSSPRSACAGTMVEHVEQRRILHLPDVLVVTLQRSVDGRPRNRAAFGVEENVSFYRCGNAELACVVYQVPSGKGDRASCACRGPDRNFSYFEDGRAPQRLGSDVSELKPHSVAVLVYVSSLGIVFDSRSYFSTSTSTPCCTL